jgi:hypothetical protein
MKKASIHPDGGTSRRMAARSARAVQSARSPWREDYTLPA